MDPVNPSALNLSGYLSTFARLLGGVIASDGRSDLLATDTAARCAVDLVLGTRQQRSKVLLIGNGGSAAIVSHLHNDLTKAAGVRTLVFNEQPLLTALANDEGYEHVFERPIALWADPGDVLVAVSSSGSSPNILRGVDAAVAAGATVVTFSGFSAGNPLRSRGHLNFYVPAEHYGLVEQAHSVLTHYLSDSAAERIGRINDCGFLAEPRLLAA